MLNWLRPRWRCRKQNETTKFASIEGGGMVAGKTFSGYWLVTALLCLATLPSHAQNPKTQGGGSFMVQCPNTTPLHPTAIANPTITSTSAGTPLTESAEPAYSGPVVTTETIGGTSLT